MEVKAYPAVSVPTAEELFARAEALVPDLRARAGIAEEQCRVPDETMDDLEKSGLFWVTSPRERGGYGYGLRELATITRILAQGCASTAWVYEFMVVYNMQIVQDLPGLLNGAPFVRAALSAGNQANAAGTAVPVNGGWRVSGLWPFASCIMNADWVMFLTTEPAPGVDGEPQLRALICQVSEVEIQDDWHYAGMAATGSNAFTLDDVFVPHDREWKFFPVEVQQEGSPDGQRHETFSILGLFAILPVACALGAVEAALVDFSARIQTRTLAFGAGAQIDHPEAWARYGRAATEVHLARTLWEDSVEQIAELVDNGLMASKEQAAMLKMATVRIAEIVGDAMEIIARGSGSRVYHLNSAMQRQQRDIMVIKSHALFDPDGNYGPGGQVLLGVEDGPSLSGH